jgi:hypothetical protein
MKMENKMNDNYFLSKGFEKNGEDIYVYKNFISNEELDTIIPTLDNARINSEYNPHFIGTGFENRMSNEIEYLRLLPNRLNDFFGKEYIVNPNITVNILSVGHDWGEHYDSHDFIQLRKLSETLKDGDPYETLQDSHYGIVIYFNTPEEGGELVYTRQDIVYRPNPGDLVIHSAEENCTHKVNAVTKGYRYSYSNHLGVDLKVPKCEDENCSGRYPDCRRYDNFYGYSK